MSYLYPYLLELPGIDKDSDFQGIIEAPNKYLSLVFGSFEFRDVPSDVFLSGVQRIEENGYTYFMATKEKALCDTLYSKYPVRSISDLKVLLFDDLRIDEELFLKLDFNFIIKIAPLYHSNTLLTLVKYIKGHYREGSK